MPATQVELDHSDKSLNGVLDLGNRKQHLWVTHEAVLVRQPSNSTASAERYQKAGAGVLGDPFEHAARLQDEGREHHPAEVGARPQLGDDVGQDYIEVSSAALRSMVFTWMRGGPFP